MKTVSVLTTAASFLPFSSALVGWGWSVENTPDSGLTDVVFPMNIANTQHESGYYFAQQISLTGQEDVAYTGLQPRPDENGASIVHAVFSSFIDGTTSDDENCSKGADGGSGYSCAVEIPAPYSNTYHLSIKNAGGDTWTGDLVDAVSSNSTHIGTFTLPSGSGGLSGNLGFIEDYAGHDAADLPYTNVTIGVPTTTTANAGKGKIDEPYEYGDTKGKVNFDFTQLSDGGYQMSCGFK